MSRAAIGWFCCLIILLFPASRAIGQAPSGPDSAAPAAAATETDPVAALAQRIDSLERDMLTKKELEDFKKELLEALDSRKTPAPPAEESAKASGERVAEERPLVSIPAAEPETAAPPTPAAERDKPVTRMEFEAVKDMVLSHENAIEQIARNVGGSGSESVYILDVMGQADKSPKFREELKAAVHKSMDQQGVVRIHNKTAWGRSVRIRATGLDKTVDVPAGALVEQPVPVGTLTTELLGQEGPRNWTIAPPNNKQEIDILPAPSVYYEPFVVW